MLQKRWQPRRPPASSPPMPSPGTSDRRAASYLARLREWRRQDRTSLLLRSGSTRVSSVALPRRLPFLNGRCSDDKRAELIIAHGYKRDYLHDHLLAASRAFHRCLAGLDHEPRPTISGAKQAEDKCAALDRALCAGVWRRAASYAPTSIAGNCRNRAMRRYLPFATISAEDVASPKSICEWAESGQGRTFFCERAIRRPKLDAAAINYFIATMACAENDGLNVFGCGRLVAGIGFLRLPASRTSALGILTYPRKPGGA